MNLWMRLLGQCSDRGMQCVLEGCTKLRKLEIRDCPFGNVALLSGLEKYESMRAKKRCSSLCSHSLRFIKYAGSCLITRQATACRDKDTVCING
ncbi:hypothetical protein OIU84_013948 [Salix udensis]|uniref:Uncharacterized protein n=1 Tax=Salix udensis TaxID=889485 RepID=A0AAD6JCP0_9ROSI|nr:hypothetical protein OIU84_013948 [Salix udensis]